VFHVSGADADANAGDRSYLVLAKPNVIMNDTRLRGLAVAGSDAAGRKGPHNHAQAARNLGRSLRSQLALLRVSGQVRHEDLHVEIFAELAIQSRQQVGEGRAVGVLRERLLRLALLDHDQSVGPSSCA
jgi:hypothetical protein